MSSKFGMAVLTVVLGVVALSGRAGAAPNPPDNIKMGELPQSCYATNSNTSAACENAIVYYLDRARASLGLSSYALPADFVQLPPDRQIFVLSNLDRIAYSLPPVNGLNQELSAAAAKGVAVGDDPDLVSWSYGWNGSYYSNWAEGYVNAPQAYYEWMYDDGYGSDNLSCKAPWEWGCWGHRKNVLFDMDGANEYEAAMGAATGSQAETGQGEYAMLIATASPHFTQQPPYYYTWTEAVADGASTNAYDPGTPDLSERQEPESGPSAALWIGLRGPKLWIRGNGFVLGRTVEIKIRREIVPCAIKLDAPRCTWVRRGAVHRLKRTLTRHTLIRVRRPGPWERVSVHALVRGFRSEGQRYPSITATRLLRGPKPRRFAH